MATPRERLDILLVARGLAASRSEAQALILAGRVHSEGRRLDKPGVRHAMDVPLAVNAGRRYVSRGGHKLASALTDLGVDPTGLDVIDVGASTGGFTQVLLEAGAHAVVALDVGKGQLDWGLRNDPRVHVIEGVNARYVEPSSLPCRAALAVIDVSFISLRLVLPAVAACLDDGGSIVALVKPQFEVGRGRVGRGGIVRDRSLHHEVLRELTAFAGERGWGVLGVAASALPGAEGNREYFLHLAPDRTGQGPDDVLVAIDAAVGSST